MPYSSAPETVVVTSNLWYGSALAGPLTAGARLLRDAFPGAHRNREVFVDTEERSERRHGVRDYEVYRRSIRDIRSLLDGAVPDRVVLLGGGCAASIAAVSHLSRRHPRLRILWIDAHGDLHTPSSSPSGYIHGMALGILTAPEAYRLFFPRDAAVPFDRVALVGQKVLDPAESAAIERHRIRRFRASGDDVGALGRFCASSSDGVYVHLDLDALHPDIYANPKCDVRDGLNIGDLTALLKTVADTATVAGIAVVESAERDASRVAAVINAVITVMPRTADRHVDSP